MAYVARVLALGFIWLSLACGGLGGSVDARAVPRVEVRAPAAEPLSDEQAAAAALALVNALKGKDEAVFVEVLDLEAGLLLATHGLLLPETVVDEAVAGVASLERATYLTNGQGLEDGFARVLEVQHRGDQIWVTVGLIWGRRNFQHYHLRVVRLPSGVKVVDLWTLAQPVPWGDSLRAGFEAVFRGADVDMEAFEQAKARAAMNGRIAAGDGEGVLAIYDAAPAAVQNSLEGHLARITGAMLIVPPPKRSRKFILKFAAAFPQSPAARKWEYVLALADGDAGAAALALEGLFDASAPDPYLLALASMHCIDAGRLDRARDLAERSVRLEPGIVETWEHLLMVAEAQRDNAAARRALDALGSLGVSASLLRADPGWKALVAMPAFSDWERSLAAARVSP